MRLLRALLGALCVTGGVAMLGVNSSPAGASGPDATTTTLSVPSSPSTYDGIAVLTATVTDTSTTTSPTGTVDFPVTVGGGSDDACQSVPLTPATADTSTAVCDWNYASWNQVFDATSEGTGGTFAVSATFDGNASFTTSSSSLENVEVLGSHVAVPRVALSPNPDAQSSGIAGSVEAAMTVTSAANPPIGSPTGTVSVVDPGTSTTLCSSALPAYSPTATTASASCSFVPPETGAMVDEELVYSGDDNFGSRIGHEKLVVAGTSAPTLSVAPAGLSFKEGARVQLVGSVPTPVVGAPVAWASMTITPPSGTPFACTTRKSATKLAPAPNGQVSCSFVPSMTGTYSVTLNYEGNQDYAAGSSAPTDFFVAGTSATSSVTLSSSANPAAYATPITVTATVADSSGTPVGTVAFLNNATGQPLPCTQGTNGQVAVSSGTAACTFTPSVANDRGTKLHVGAVYLGDATASPSSTYLLLVVRGGTAPATFALSAAPSSGLVRHEPVTFIATMTGPTGDPAPAGTVTFKATGVLKTRSAFPLSKGSAFWTTKLPAGTETVTISYSGDTLYEALPFEASGYSDTVTLTVAR